MDRCDGAAYKTKTGSLNQNEAEMLNVFAQNPLVRTMTMTVHNKQIWTMRN
jgi:hypothetical protein